MAAFTLALAACQAESTPAAPDRGASSAIEDSAAPTPTSGPRIADNRGRGFVPLDNPVFIGADVATLHDDDLVLGYANEGEARAYPVAMMRYHHIVNDEVQGDPLLVTY